MRFEALLGRTVRGFWATSYSFDLKLFDQYLLRRLAESPLNAVILADHDKLSATWEQLHEAERYLAKQVGRRYLLRGVRIPSGGVFHPKTYLFARADHATLVVGSGNLTRPGIDHGREVFVVFTTQREEDLPSMRAWAQWMGRLVQSQSDPLLAERWAALREASLWMTGSTDGSTFLTNDQHPLLNQLVDRLPDSVRELHVTAPFFDKDAIALERLIDACRPQQLTIYVGESVSVHGPSLSRVLSRFADVRLKRFEPRSFVHAKLIGVVADGRSLLLSGSANLSRAALLSTYTGPQRGNCEAAVLREGEPEDVRRVFETSGLKLVDQPLEWLDGLAYADDHPSLGYEIALRSACWRKDGRIRLRWDGASPDAPADRQVAWEGGPEPVPIDSEHTTVDRLDQFDPLPVLVSLVDAAGTPVSNRVVVDDPAALRATLAGSRPRTSTRPSGLEGLEMIPLVALVLWAHDKFIFEPDETEAFRRAENAAGESQAVEDATRFWERLATEELLHDSRVQSYKPLTVSGASASPVDELLRELELLLQAAPATDSGLDFRLLGYQHDEDDDGEPARGTPWSMEARQRVRAVHVLTRWARALADPRHALIDAHAPVVNYETLVGIILVAWVKGALDEKQLRKLLLTTLDAFIGSGPGDGFLGRISDEQRNAAVAALSNGFVEITAGLVYAAIEPSGWPDDIYDWQPCLARGIEYGVVLPGPLSESVVTHLDDDVASKDEIGELLAQRLDWVDDKTWCKRLAAELDLQSLRLQARNSMVRLGVVVVGSADPLHDTRLLTVARRALAFKRESAIALSADRDAFVFEPGARARALVAGVAIRSELIVESTRLRDIEDQGGSWADVLGVGGSRRAA